MTGRVEGKKELAKSSADPLKVNQGTPKINTKRDKTKAKDREIGELIKN